jgi:hypothetical protein
VMTALHTAQRKACSPSSVTGASPLSGAGDCLPLVEGS